MIYQDFLTEPTLGAVGSLRLGLFGLKLENQSSLNTKWNQAIARLYSLLLPFPHSHSVSTLLLLYICFQRNTSKQYYGITDSLNLGACKSRFCYPPPTPVVSPHNLTCKVSLDGGYTSWTLRSHQFLTLIQRPHGTSNPDLLNQGSYLYVWEDDQRTSRDSRVPAILCNSGLAVNPCGLIMSPKSTEGFSGLLPPSR